MTQYEKEMKWKALRILLYFIIGSATFVLVPGIVKAVIIAITILVLLWYGIYSILTGG
jgi:uncharacterized protein involved in cysteine biosynthesis